MKKFLNILKDILEILLEAFLVFFICTRFILVSAIVVGTSMYPTLSDGDRGLSFRITKVFGIDRFDICVIEQSEDNRIVKRVIGLPGEKVEYKDNKLYINDEYFEENFLDNVQTNDFIVVLNDDEYFCLGDNREISKDSRYYGPFSKEQIISTNFITLFPKENFGIKK